MRLLDGTAATVTDFSEPSLSLYALDPALNERSEVLELATLYNLNGSNPSRKTALVVPATAFHQIGVQPTPDGISRINHPKMKKSHHIAAMDAVKAEQLLELVKQLEPYQIMPREIKEKVQDLYKNDPDFKQLMDAKSPSDKRKFGIKES